MEPTPHLVLEKFGSDCAEILPCFFLPLSLRRRSFFAAGKHT